jgi:hypothetical protein
LKDVTASFAQGDDLVHEDIARNRLVGPGGVLIRADERIPYMCS